MRHKWNGNSKKRKKATSNKGGFAVSCIKCGCVKEYINGKVSYFINDTSYDKAPTCLQKIHVYYDIDFPPHLIREAVPVMTFEDVYNGLKKS